VAGPRDVADGTRLQKPFHYDPTKGNLLIEWLSLQPSLTPPPNNDGLLTSGINRIIVGAPNSMTASAFPIVAAVVQFEFVPEPSTFVLAGMALTFHLTWRRKERGRLGA
jgi:hypothetical protein